MQTIICPHCKESIEISQALENEYKSTLQAEFDEKHKHELKKQKEELEEKTEKRIKEEMELKIKDKENEAQEAKDRSKKLQEEILNLTKLMREMKEKDEVREQEMQKKLDLQIDDIRKKEQEKAAEEQHKKISEKDKQLADALKEVEDMKRKLQQGSQQLQGEAFELEFEEKLRNEFPNDQIEEVAKGTKGGDIIQQVWDRNGNYCGKILWELKNTKTWSEQWIDKLKQDQRGVTADIAVIISEAVPEDIDTARFYKNVWVTKKQFVIALASSIRVALIQVSMAKKASEGQKEKRDILYTYLSGTEFRLRIEALVDAFTNMQLEIEKEKRYFSNKWARDEKNIRIVIDNTYGMHGDLKGIMGNVLPQIKGLDLLEDGKEE